MARKRAVKTARAPTSSVALVRALDEDKDPVWYVGELLTVDEDGFLQLRIGGGQTFYIPVSHVIHIVAPVQGAELTPEIKVERTQRSDDD